METRNEDSWDLYGIPGWGLVGKLLFLEVGSQLEPGYKQTNKTCEEMEIGKPNSRVHFLIKRTPLCTAASPAQ